MKTKTFTTSFLFLAIHYFSFSQDFTFTLYFSDALGNQDSVMLGYDATATYGLDAAFGEIDISAQAFDTTFEVRAAAYNYDNLSTACQYWDAPLWDIESKTFITYFDCSLGEGLEQEFNAIAVLIKAEHLPITVSWDNALFTTACHDQSFLANWVPGGWFDACCCFGNGDVINLGTNSSYTFEVTDAMTIKGNDTLFTLYVPIADEVILNTEQLQHHYNIDVTPNPSSGQINFIVPSEVSIDQPLEVMVYDQTGKMIARNRFDRNLELDLSAHPAGLYFYTIVQEHFTLQQGRLMLVD